MENFAEVSELIQTCLSETATASKEKYDSDKAEKTAALFLLAQIKLSLIIEDAELKYKLAKNEIERVEADKYFEIKAKIAGTGKVTESALTNYVAKDPDVLIAKNTAAETESDFKKWNFLLTTLKDGHIFFRNLSKNKAWQE